MRKLMILVYRAAGVLLPINYHIETKNTLEGVVFNYGRRIKKNTKSNKFK